MKASLVILLLLVYQQLPNNSLVDDDVLLCRVVEVGDLGALGEALVGLVAHVQTTIAASGSSPQVSEALVVPDLRQSHFGTFVGVHVRIYEIKNDYRIKVVKLPM